MVTDPDDLSVNWSARIRVRLYLAAGAVLMVPFGTIVAGGTCAALASAPSNLAAAYRDDLGDLVVSGLGLLVTVAFGGFLAYALLRHGLSCLYDAIGPGRVVEGDVEDKRLVPGRRGVAHRVVVVAGQSFDCAREPFALVRVGTRVRARFGRFERNLEELWILSRANPSRIEADSKLS